MDAGESPLLTVITMWAAVAWADGVLAPAEADSLHRLIDGAQLGDAERAAATRLLAAPVALPVGTVMAMSPESRKGVYRAACRIALVDLRFARSERSTLHKLRDLLTIPADVAIEIEADVPGMAQARVEG